MINVAGHLREQNGTYQMILSWKDTNGKRRTKSISTGLPIKGNKKRAEALLRQTQKEFNPETMQQICDLPVSEYFTRWLRESVMSLSPETYGRYAYDMGKVIMPYFEKKQLSLKALAPRDLETFSATNASRRKQRFSSFWIGTRNYPMPFSTPSATTG